MVLQGITESVSDDWKEDKLQTAFTHDQAGLVPFHFITLFS